MEKSGQYLLHQLAQAVTKSIERLTARLTKLKKQHSSMTKEREVSDFLQEEFVLPKLGYCNGKVVNFSPIRKSTVSRVPVNKHQNIKDMRQKIYAINRNANKRLKRREAVILKQEQCIQEQKDLIVNYERKLSGTEVKLKKLHMKLDRVNHRAAYWEKQACESRSSRHGEKLRAEIASLKEEVAALDLINAELHETVQLVMSESDITTFENGKYTDNIQASLYI